MQKHITAIGVLFIVKAVLGILFAFLALAALASVGMMTQDESLMAVLPLIILFGAYVALVTSLPAIVGGWALLYRKNWARWLVIVLAILSLIELPFGTALGIYTLVILFKDEVKPLFT